MTQSNPRQIFVVGSLNQDTVYRVESAPDAGETVSSLAIQVAVGGKGGNQAIAAARAGAAVTMVGSVGTDQAGADIKMNLRDAAVNVLHVHESVKSASGSAVVIVDNAGENRIVLSRGANSDLATSSAIAALEPLSKNDILIVQNEIDAEVTCAAAALARDRGAYVIWNAAPAPSTLQEIPASVSLIVANERELQALAVLYDLGETSIPWTVEALSNATNATVVCTVGAAGSYFASPSGAGHVPATRVVVVDTTAAGDTFVGYLAANLSLTTHSLEALVCFANRAAGLAVTRSGASPSIPTRADVLAISS